MGEVPENRYQILSEIARRRGLFWFSYEIYGGVKGLITLGPIGALIKRKLEDAWIRWFVHYEGYQLIESPVIGPEKVYIASGHVESFIDYVVECKKCGKKWRADHLISEATGLNVEGLPPEELEKIVKEKNVRCPSCKGELGAISPFNLMFETTIGPYSGNKGYCRPETAQGIFTEFKRLYNLARGTLPFSTAQVGRVFRNEISPRQGPIRLREFTIMELETFFDPKDSPPDISRILNIELPILSEEEQRRGGEEIENIPVKELIRKNKVKTEWQVYYMVRSKQFLNKLGIKDNFLRFREKLPWERAHYAKQLYDLEVLLGRFGWIEIAGFAYRTDYDLSSHSRYSGEKFVIKRSDGSEFTPHVVEPSFGCERLLYAVLEHSLRITKNRNILSLPPFLAPYDAAVFPLLSREPFVSHALSVFSLLRKEGLHVIYDDSGSIGRRYARVDEIGVPYAITIDGETLENNSVTLRFRDTSEQIRIDIKHLSSKIKELIDSSWKKTT
ncbi:glycine--tRNA ligase [Candidatus Bathyarchaeota archaeon ex4484_205]|nr:MAG: glycine--tRNA ligase [Candidatus Bathyarchaeota archaeon ex4484_205]RLG67459.1 MAG: glycine--tRNA ligase [archaeon]